VSEYPSPELLVQLLRSSGHRTTKSLGQHFMTDAGVLGALVDALELTPSTLAVEIGPGPLTLTTLLAGRAGGVVSIERDTRLKDFHDRVFAGKRHVAFVYEDAMRVEFPPLVSRFRAQWGLDDAVLTGNLPYQITSPLLFGQLGPDAPWRRIVVMIQKEVADRILAPPHTRAYGILSVKIAYWWEARRIVDVPAAIFLPPPKVDGTVLALVPKTGGPAPDPAEWRALSRFIDLCFNQRRKKLYNSPAVTSLGPDGIQRAKEALETLGIDANVRAEDLSPEQFLWLFRRLQ
jgi:16S rRNA (adenine1518-N6/adenine1519-N6)-dimethyltransferase